MIIKNLPESERPYEKAQMYGIESLSNAELLAIIIKTGTKEKTSVQLAQELLAINTENKENIDENYEKALEIARKARKISASLLQLELHIPYSEASRIINKMEENGIIKGQKGNGRRKVNRKAFKEEE